MLAKIGLPCCTSSLASCSAKTMQHGE